MRPARLRTAFASAALLAGLATAPLAAAGQGYPQTVGAASSEAREYGWSSERDGYIQESGYAEHREYSDRDGYRERAWSDEHAWASDGRAEVDEGVEAPVVGYLPVSFFGDAGGVGSYAIDGGYGGGGGFVYGGASAGAFAHASASVSASISIHGGFHGGGHGGGHHGGGGHGCGCK